MGSRKRYSADEIRAIYDRTRGKCHLCHKQLSIANYGLHRERGAWQVDHSVPVSRNGTDHGNNLKPACIPCNLHKSACCTRTARRRNGTRRAPLPRQKFQAAKTENTVFGGGLGATIGGLVFGPVGAAVGAFVGAALGDSVDPDA